MQSSHIPTPEESQTTTAKKNVIPSSIPLTQADAKAIPVDIKNDALLAEPVFSKLRDQVSFQISLSGEDFLEPASLDAIRNNTSVYETCMSDADFPGISSLDFYEPLIPRDFKKFQSTTAAENFHQLICSIRIAAEPLELKVIDDCLQSAIMFDDLDALAFLISKQPKPDFQTLIQVAIQLNKAKSLEYLVCHGAFYGKNPAELHADIPKDAVDCRDFIRTLREGFAITSPKRMKQFLKEQPYAFYWKNALGETLLHQAIRLRRFELVFVLVTLANNHNQYLPLIYVNNTLVPTNILFANEDRFKLSPLPFAAYVGAVEEFKFLLLFVIDKITDKHSFQNFIHTLVDIVLGLKTAARDLPYVPKSEQAVLSILDPQVSSHFDSEVNLYKKIRAALKDSFRTEHVTRAMELGFFNVACVIVANLPAAKKFYRFDEELEAGQKFKELLNDIEGLFAAIKNSNAITFEKLFKKLFPLFNENILNLVETIDSLKDLLRQSLPKEIWNPIDSFKRLRDIRYSTNLMSDLPTATNLWSLGLPLESLHDHGALNEFGTIAYRVAHQFWFDEQPEDKEDASLVDATPHPTLAPASSQGDFKAVDKAPSVVANSMFAAGNVKSTAVVAFTPATPDGPR
jgi:hypothetical protein